MAQTKIKIYFQTAGGFDAELELVPGEKETASRLMLDTEKYLQKIGCKPRPRPAAGGYQKKPVETVPGKECPKCAAGMVAKEGTNKAGRPYKGFGCVKGCGGWLNA